MSAAARRGRTMYQGARGAHPMTHHGPLEREVRRLHGYLLLVYRSRLWTEDNSSWPLICKKYFMLCRGWVRCAELGMACVALEFSILKRKLRRNAAQRIDTVIIDAR
jgi:hypothetical protein